MNILAKSELKSPDQAIRETIYRGCLLLDGSNG